MGIDTGLGTGPRAHAQTAVDGGLQIFNCLAAAPTLERETGIEPASLAWKARVLPLNYSRKRGRFFNPRRLSTALHKPLLSIANPQKRLGGGGWIRTSVGVSQQIYSLPPLATRAPLRDEPGTIARLPAENRSPTGRRGRLLPRSRSPSATRIRSKSPRGMGASEGRHLAVRRTRIGPDVARLSTPRQEPGAGSRAEDPAPFE